MDPDLGIFSKEERSIVAVISLHDASRGPLWTIVYSFYVRLGVVVGTNTGCKALTIQAEARPSQGTTAPLDGLETEATSHISHHSEN